MCLIAVAPARADDGGKDSGDGGSDDGDNSEPSGDGGGGDGDDGGIEQENGDDESRGTSGHSSSGAGANGGTDRTGVLPLKTMLAIFQGYGQSTIVDVRLVERQSILVYAFKFIDTQGRVKRAYFDAHTGKAIA